MRRTSRAIASALGLTLALSACGGQSSSVAPGLPGTTGLGSDSTARVTGTTPVTAPVSVPRLTGALAYTDVGRRNPQAPVSITLTLRYNHQDELDQLVARLNAPGAGKRQFLSAHQFNSYFAPTVTQEGAVVRALQSAGFTITQRFSNRTIVDAKAPSATVERFFATEIHTVRQGKYGERFTNVKPATVPAAIAPFVRDASLDDLIVVRTGVDQQGGSAARVAPQLAVTVMKPGETTTLQVARHPARA